MATTDGARPVLSEVLLNIGFLTSDEQKTLSETIKEKILRAVQELSRNFHEVVAQRQRDKVTYDQHVFDLDSELRDNVNKLEELQVQLIQERKSTEDYVDKYRNTLTIANELEDTVRRLQNETSDVQIKLEHVLAEKIELSNVVEKRNVEIEKLVNDVQSIGEQLQSATVAKIEALAKVDELTSKEIELDYKEKQIEREREWVSKQVQLLNEELDKKNMEIVDMQRETSLKYLNLQTDLAEKSEQIHIAELSLDNIKKSNEQQEKHIEVLITKLKDAQEVQSKMEEHYRQELKSQKKIADLYRDSSEESGRKVEELEDAVSNLQDLLKLATERYGDLETRFSNASKSFQEEITQRDQSIDSLKKELSDANDLLSSIKKHGMTDEMIQALSPAAAAASNMLKNTQSLTEVYSRYQSLYTEMIIAKAENEKLNGYISEIVKDIEERAPILKRQKEDYENAMQTLSVLNNQLELAVIESANSKSESAHLKKTVGGLERENGRLKLQLTDISLQVKALLKEVEVNRGHYSFTELEDSAEVPDINQPTQNSSKIISNRLVTFRNIDELQAQNQHLLAIVRELSDAQEKAEEEIHTNQLQQIKEAFESAKTELEELRTVRIRQEQMLESVAQQRDTFSALLKQHKSPGKSGNSASNNKQLQGLEKQLAEAQTATKILKEEYDNYRKEKAENDRLSSEQIERLRDDVVRMRTDNAKLASQAEYSNERAKIYTANLESYKKSICVLEERSKQYSLTVMKLEQSVETLKTELSGTHQKLARTEVALSSMAQERNVLRDSKARLQAERDLYHREHSTQQILHTNLQEIKNGLEMSNSAVKVRLENQVDNLQQQCNVLRRKVESENDRFKETILSWDTANKELREKLEAGNEQMNVVKKELSSSQDVIRRQRNEIEDLMAQVRVLTGSSTNLPSINQSPGKLEHSSENPKLFVLEKKVKELNLQLIDTQTEIRSLKQQLEFSKSNLEEYKRLCTSMEEQVQAATVNSKTFNEELTERLACKDDIIRDIQLRLDIVDKENHKFKEERDNATRELEGKSVHLEEELNRMRRELQTANSKLQAAMEDKCKIKNDLDRNVHISREMQEKYEKELTLHAQDIRDSGDIKLELESLRRQVGDEEATRRTAEETLKEAQINWETKENLLTAELEQSRKNMMELETLNASLQDQLINLSTQINSLRDTEQVQENSTKGQSAEASFNASFSESDPKTSEQWLQLIRYLRREKEIANTKTEMAQTTTQRLTSQLKFMEKQYEEVRHQFNEMQDRSHVSVITSAKQAELLRKVETLSALTDSNRMLREEKDIGLKEIEDLRLKLGEVEQEMGPLRVKNVEFETKCESLTNENISLKQDASRWRARASSLLEKSNKVNPEEMKKLQTDKDNLQKQLLSLQEGAKKQQQEIARQTQQIKMLQQQLLALQSSNQSLQQEKKSQLEELKRVCDENTKFKGEIESLRSDVSSINTMQDEKHEELERIKKEHEKVQGMLDEHKNTVKQVKNIARKYKKQYEDLTKENETLIEQKATLEQSSKAAESAFNVSHVETTTEDLLEGQLHMEESLRQEMSVIETRLRELADENETLKRDLDTVKVDSSQKQEQTKVAIKNLREKLATCNQQKEDVQYELNECKTKLSIMEISNEENSVRLAALKSQYEGRLGRLEKENKDLKVAGGLGTSGTAPSAGGSELATVNVSLQQENERQKKELDMLRQRMLVVEKQYKLQSQQQTSKGPSVQEKTQSDPPKANIKPIAGTSSSTVQKQITQIVPPGMSRPPLTASIRPMSMQIRKATVMPTTATATAMPTQQQSGQLQQPSSASVQPLPAFVAPVSQAQVSTSTPDQSSATETAQHLPVTSSAVTPTVTNSTNVRQATVQPTPAVTIVPIASTNNVVAIGTATPVITPQGPVSDRDSTSASHEDPSTSTSHVEDSEMGDSSEQVSSSESSSTHQPMLTVAPIRSQQLDQIHPGSSQLGNQSSAGLEEPSPSTSTSAPRPSQSGKRVRDSEVETSQESRASDEPESKRTRTIPMPVDREAEAMAHQQEHPPHLTGGDQHEDEGQEHEADQGRPDEENQVPHSDTSENKAGTSGSAATESLQDDDDDSDVIVIDSDDEGDQDAVDTQRLVAGHPTQHLGDDDDEEEDIDEEDELADEEEIDEEEELDEDEVGDMDDDENDDGEADGMEQVDDDDDNLQHEEGREAESLEHEGESHEADPASGLVEPDEADMIAEGDGDFDSHHGMEEQEQGRHDIQSAEIEPLDLEHRSETGGDSVSRNMPSASVRESSPGSSSHASRLSSSQSSSARPPPRSIRQERLTSYGRQQIAPSFQSSQAIYGDDIDDSIVPSTPTLYVPRRSDGFAEAVSSPQIPTQGRFIFSTPSDTTTPAGSSGMEDTRVDLLQYDECTGRSVPTTPLQISPPELDVQVEAPYESRGVPQELVDVEPSSSNASRSGQNNGMDIPSITITSVMDSSLDSIGDQDLEVDISVNSQTDSDKTEEAHGGEVHPLRTETSVTSSDEDKLDGGASTSGGGTQQPSTSSTSRAASPAPSSALVGLGEQPQQHRVRPTPIIWDQPTSSSSVPPVIPRIRGRGMMGRQMQVPPEQSLDVPVVRGGFRQLRGASVLRGAHQNLRGAQQSARRSRPHSRGPMRGSPFSKPY